MLGQAQQPMQILKELADRQMPIWKSVRKEFIKNLATRSKVLKTLRPGETDFTSQP